MIQVKCNQMEHQESPIQALCLRKECKQNSAYCARCVKLHPDCANHLKFLDEVPAATSQLKSMREHFRDAFKIIIKQTNQLEQIVNEHFSSIDQLTFNPTLTSFNKLGQLLKESKPFDISGLDRWKNSILQNLDQFNNSVQSIKQIMDPARLSQEEKNLVYKYNKEGLELYNNGQYSKAIECYNKSTNIDRDNVDSWYFQGIYPIFLGNSLFYSNKYQQAIECFDKCIKIDPRNRTSYYWKGFILRLLKKNEEAIACFDEQNKIQPHGSSYEKKGSSLKKLSYLHLKDAEKCYFEAIKHFPNNKEFNFEARLLKVQSKVKMQK